ncbi:MAG: DedA family protein [Acidobacteria bacterium]|nr:DedA family protein [Acidobacteriota bacterium]
MAGALMFAWIRKLYDWTLGLASRPTAIYWLGAVSFAESSFFPIPPDLMIIPMCLANRERTAKIVTVATLASILGGLFGYWIGFYAFDSIGVPILNFYGAMDKYDQFQHYFDLYGAIMIVVAGFSPIPYKVITISAGVFHFPIGLFFLLSFASRGCRFALEGVLLWFFGQKAQTMIDKHFNKLTIVAAVLLVGGFVAVKWIAGKA